MYQVASALVHSSPQFAPTSLPLALTVSPTYYPPLYPVSAPAQQPITSHLPDVPSGVPPGGGAPSQQLVGQVCGLQQVSPVQEEFPRFSQEPAVGPQAHEGLPHGEFPPAGAVGQQEWHDVYQQPFPHQPSGRRQVQFSHGFQQVPGHDCVAPKQDVSGLSLSY